MKKRLRRRISILLSLSMIISATPFTGLGCRNSVKAETNLDETGTEYTDGSGFVYVLYEENTESSGSGTSVQKAEITGYAGSDSDLIIPNKLGEYDVGKIGDAAFLGTEITSVVISEGIDTIGYSAFQGCEKLVKVEIPSSIKKWKETSYNNSAFENCTALQELKLAEGLTTLGQRAFAGCSSLERVRVPSAIQTFPNQVFADCTSLCEVELAEGIRQIGYEAFAGCSALVEITIPSSIEIWGLIRANGVMAQTHECYPFKGCTSLKKIIFSDGLKTLQNFSGVKDCPLITEIDVPASVTNIEYAFNGCTDLKKVTLHDGLTEIGANAFNGCTSLLEVQIPNTVTTVGGGAFTNCSALESITFPPSLKSNSASTYGCNNLKAIYMLNDSIDWYQKLTLPSSAKIYCIEGSKTYNLYLSGMQNDGMQDQLTVFPDAGVTAEGCSVIYDGEAHEAVKLSGVQEGDEVLYQMEGKDGFSTESPKITEPGTYPIVVCVKRIVQGEAPHISSLRTQAKIQKKTCSIVLQDMEVSEQEEYTVNPSQYEGEADLVYTYYKDEALQEVCNGKPSAPGVYYVKATAAESVYYAAGESNVAKITIRKADTGTEPPEGPGVTPVTDPPVEPGVTPSTKPSIKPSTKPSTKPSIKPNVTSGTKPSSKPTDKSNGKKKVSVKPVDLKKVKSPSKKAIEVQWKKVSGASGYQICLGLNKNMTKGKKTVNVKGGKKTKKVIKKLKRKKKYYVKVRAYKTVKGKKNYGDWSKVKKVKVK